VLLQRAIPVFFIQTCRDSSVALLSLTFFLLPLQQGKSHTTSSC
jgi:hypothetical protein